MKQMLLVEIHTTHNAMDIAIRRLFYRTNVEFETDVRAGANIGLCIFIAMELMSSIKSVNSFPRYIYSVFKLMFAGLFGVCIGAVCGALIPSLLMQAVCYLCVIYVQ